jgi:predicted DNA-binding antitoxin AbrB/MazE fold protein
MVRTIRAKFSKGVFQPLEPAVADAIREGEEVLITISTPATVLTGDPVAETAGGWVGLVDGEELKRNIYADRLIATRSAIRL